MDVNEHPELSGSQRSRRSPPTAGRVAVSKGRAVSGRSEPPSRRRPCPEGHGGSSRPQRRHMLRPEGLLSSCEEQRRAGPLADARAEERA